MKIETVDIATISPDPANVRKHGGPNLEAIKSSLRRFGQQKPIVVDSNGVVRAGNGTLEAAVALGWKKIAVVRSGLKGADAVAYALADNRTSELSAWDHEGLARTLESLKDQDASLISDAGFTDADLRALAAQFAGDEPAEDKTTEINVDAFDLKCRCPRCGFEFNPKQ